MWIPNSRLDKVGTKNTKQAAFLGENLQGKIVSKVAKINERKKVSNGADRNNLKNPSKALNTRKIKCLKLT